MIDGASHSVSVVVPESQMDRGGRNKPGMDPTNTLKRKRSECSSGRRMEIEERKTVLDMS